MHSPALMSKRNLVGMATLTLLGCAAAVTGCGNIGRLNTGSPTMANSRNNPSPPTDSVRSNVTITIPQGASERQSSAFGTKPTQVQPGTMVTWVNSDDLPHSATSTLGLFDSKLLGPGQSYSFTFKTPGKYTYRSAVRGEQDMTGTIIVSSVADHEGDPNPYPTSTVNPEPYEPNPHWPDGDNEQQQEKHKKKPHPRPTLYNPGEGSGYGSGGGTGY